MQLSTMATQTTVLSTPTVDCDASSMSSLVPIRIDVSSSSNNWRLVDTLLVDTKSNLSIDAATLAMQLYTDAMVETGPRQSTTTHQSAAATSAVLTEMTRQIESQYSAAIVAATEVRHVQATTSSSTDAGVATVATVSTAKNDNPKLIRIVLRLSFRGILIHDDFWWDPCLDNDKHGFDARQMAESIALDLNLPVDAIPALALEIVEQIVQAQATTVSNSASNNSNNIPMPFGEDNRLVLADDVADARGAAEDQAAATAANNNPHVEPNTAFGQPSDTSSMQTGAWLVAPTSQSTHVSHLTAHYYPIVGTFVGSSSSSRTTVHGSAKR